MNIIVIPKYYVVASIMNVKDKYLNGECVTDMEANTICNWINEYIQSSLNGANAIVVDVINERIFTIKNGIIFLNKNYTLDYLIEDYKMLLDSDFSKIIFDEKDMINRISKYKELQCSTVKNNYQGRKK